MKKILLSGFEPFQNEPINPSREIALAFQKKFDTLILPVSYKRAFERLHAQLTVKEYDFILMMGQAGGRKWIDLERVAINLQDSELPDEDGVLQLQQPIALQGPDAFLNPLPLRDIVRWLQKKNVPAQISFSAGAFVCNSLYFQVFDFIKKSRLQTQALFVHLPYLPEQLTGKPEETPSLSLQQMKNSVDEILQLMQKLEFNSSVKS